MKEATTKMIEMLLGGDTTVTTRQREFILAACRNPALAVEDSPLEMEPAATVAEAARALRVCRRTVERLVASGGIRTRIVLGRRYVPHSEIRRLLVGTQPAPGPLPESTPHRECLPAEMASAKG